MDGVAHQQAGEVRDLEPHLPRKARIEEAHPEEGRRRQGGVELLTLEDARGRSQTLVNERTQSLLEAESLNQQQLKLLSEALKATRQEAKELRAQLEQANKTMQSEKALRSGAARVKVASWAARRIRHAVMLVAWETFTDRLARVRARVAVERQHAHTMRWRSRQNDQRGWCSYPPTYLPTHLLTCLLTYRLT